MPSNVGKALLGVLTLVNVGCPYQSLKVSILRCEPMLSRRLSMARSMAWASASWDATRTPLAIDESEGDNAAAACLVVADFTLQAFYIRKRLAKAVPPFA